jgi:Kef-type K+ transport system membrane component KefB
LTLSPFAALAVQLGLLLAAATVLGRTAERLGLPSIVGEILAGVVVGRSGLGNVAPEAFAALFSPTGPVAQARGDLLRIGLLLFVLLVGLELEPERLGGRWPVVLPVSLLGMILPFGLGYAAVALAPDLWEAGRPATAGLPAMLGVALAISALPVIARIMTDLDIIRTQIGRIVLSAAVLNDLFGWLGFAAVLGTHGAAEAPGGSIWSTVALVVGAFAGALAVGHLVGASAAAWLRSRPRQSGSVLGLVLALALLASGLIEVAGVHAFFGALLVGLAASRLDPALFEPLVRLVRIFFTPLYFGAVALDLDLLASFDWRISLVVFLIACLGKLVGVTAGALIGGLAPRPALAVAAALNARGAVEVVLATTARQAGLIDDRLFVALVVMALGTSILAGAVLPHLIDRRQPVWAPSP